MKKQYIKPIINIVELDDEDMMCMSQDFEPYDKPHDWHHGGHHEHLPHPEDDYREDHFIPFEF